MRSIKWMLLLICLIIGIAIAAEENQIQRYFLVDIDTKKSAPPTVEPFPCGAMISHVWIAATKEQYEAGFGNMPANIVDQSTTQGRQKRADFEKWDDDKRLKLIVKLLINENNILREKMGMPARTVAEIKQILENLSAE